MFRYSNRAVKTLATIVALILLTIVAAIWSLDTAPVRARIRALVKLPIDWHHTRLSLTSGLRLYGFTIANEPPFDKIAPNFLEVDRVDVSWALLQTLGSGPLTERVVISGVRVVVVIDEQGKTSLSALSAPEVKTMAPTTIPEATPLSETLQVLGDRLPIQRAVLRDATLRVVKLRVDGPPRELKAAFEAEVALPKVNEIDAQVSVKLIEQAIIEELPPVRDLLNVSAHASFRPTEHRVVAEVKSLSALDHALSGTTTLVLADAGPPLLEKAKLALDTTPVQATLDHQRSPLKLRGTATLDAAQVRLGKIPVVETDGKIELETKLAMLALHLYPLHVEGEALDVQAKLFAPAPHVAPMPDAPLGRAELVVKAGRFALTNGTFAIALHQVDMGAKIEGVDPYASSALRMVQALHTEGKMARMELRPGPLTVIAEPVSIDCSLQLPSVEPGKLALSIPVGALTVALDGHPMFTREPAQLHTNVAQVRLDLADPLRSEGTEQSEIKVGGLALRSRLEKHATDALKYELDFSAASLAPFAELVAFPAGYSMPFSSISAHAHTAGQIEGLRSVSSIQLRHQTTLEVMRPEVRGPHTGSARRVALAFSSQGGLVRHQADVKLDVERFLVGEYDLGDAQLAAKLGFDRAKSSVMIDATLKGDRVPALALKADASYSAGSKALAWSLSGHAERLGPVVRFVPRAVLARHQLNWEHLALELDGHGVLQRAITGWSGASPRLASDPFEAARGDLELSADLHGVDYHDTIKQLKAAVTTLHAGLTVHAADGDREDARVRRTAKLSLTVDLGRVETGDHALGVVDWKPVLTVDARGKARTPEVLANLDMTLAKLEQDFYPPYPVGKLTLGATVRADTAGLLRAERFEVSNEAAGSRAALKGGVDLKAPLTHAARNDDLVDDASAGSTAPRRLTGRVGLDVQLDLAQRLSGFALAENVKASGEVKLPVRIQSADLRLFLVRGTLGLSEVNATIGEQFEAKKVEGQVPFAVEVLVERGRKQDGSAHMRVRMVPHAEGVNFPRPRFAEHQPFLAERSFFAAEQLRYRKTVLGPLAGNLSLDHTRLQLSQIEMQASGGRVRGQLIVDVAGLDTTIAFRGDVTGVMPPSAKHKDDRLDANIALLIKPMQLQIDGRTELLHISRPLLLDLLDTWDPYHADVTANRARLALKFGYPERVRLGFEQGFASLRLELGGLTRAVRIDEIKGVPMGPLLEHFLGAAMRPLMMADGVAPPPTADEPEE